MTDIFIDESGNLGKGEQFFIIAAVQFESDDDYKKWKNLAKRVIKNKNNLREIKSSAMDYDSKKEILQQIKKRNIRFTVWLGIIDTNHKRYKERFILKNNSKELAFNYTLKKMFERCIAKNIQKRHIVVCVDQRNTKTGSRYSLKDYLNVEFIHNQSITLQSVSIEYCDSKRSYGVQLSDLVANITYTKFEYNKSNHLFETYIKPKILGECSYPEC